jgi:hypothetical protein
VFNIFSALALSYVAGSGTVTNASLIGRGLVRAARSLAEGDYRQAGVETAAALASPALVSYATVAGFVMDAAAAAGDLATGAVGRFTDRSFDHQDRLAA